MPLTRSNILMFLLMMCSFGPLFAQDNVGIGTATPHPSAILEISDSARGVLIPRTDTVSVAEYVASLDPPTTIANGLLIMDTNLNTYVFFDGVKGHWTQLIGIIGPTGPKGFQGPRGPTGPTGLGIAWIDSVIDPKFEPTRDTCGDWWLNTESGKVWWVWCDSVGGSDPPHWIDTNSYDAYIGELKAPDEIIHATTVHCSNLLLQNMSNSGISFRNLPGLSYAFNVERDEIAYVWAYAYGTTRKAFGGTDVSYAQYDIEFQASQYQPGAFDKFYYARIPDSIAHLVTIGPNGPPPSGELIGLYDLAGWHVSSFFVLEGPKSPFPCGPCGPGLCTACTPLNGNVNIQVIGGNRYSGSAGSGDILIIGDDLSTDQKAHLSVYAIVRRNPKTWPWKQ